MQKYHKNRLHYWSNLHFLRVTLYIEIQSMRLLKYIKRKVPSILFFYQKYKSGNDQMIHYW